MSHNSRPDNRSRLTRSPLHMLETSAQKAAFCCFLINSTADVSGLGSVSIDADLFSLFVRSSVHLSKSARLALALSLLGDLLVGIERQHHTSSAAHPVQHRLTPTVKPQ